MVTITSSSLMSDSQALSALVGRISTRCVTKPHQRSWMQINIKDVKIKLTHYTLRHYNSWDTEALRYWNLEGSNDGQSWIPIRQHMDDKALRRVGASHTWPVDTNQYFSFFRIYMTGRNSNNHWYLACSGVEFYGNAFGGIVSKLSDAQIIKIPSPSFQIPQIPQIPIAPQMPIPVQNINSNSFDYDRDFDQNGLVHFLATKCNTQQWQNPVRLGLYQYVQVV